MSPARHDWPVAQGIKPADMTNPAGVDVYTATVTTTDPAFGNPETVPPGLNQAVLPGYRAAWWTWYAATPPGGARPAQVRAHGATGPVTLQVFSADTPSSWGVAGNTGSAGTADTDPLPNLQYVTLTPGRRYYARVSSAADTGQDLTITVEGLYPADVHTPGDPYALPAADVGVDAPPPVTTTSTAVPLAPTGISVPGRRPAFTVTVDNDTPGQHVEVQWGPDPALAVPAGSAVNDAPAGLDSAQIAVQADTDLGDGVVYWRARITGPYGPGDWSAVVQFAVNSLEGEAVAAGDLSVTAAAVAVPHLWYIDVAETGTDAGEQAVIIGTGFGATPVVLLGALVCTVLQVLDVPEDPSHSSDPRIIPGTACTPAHQQITFLIPAVDADHVGDALTVQKG